MSDFKILRYLGVGLAMISAAVCAACSSGGFLEPPRPSGTIVAGVVGGPLLNTTSSSPYITAGGFQVSLSESGYTAQFLATISSFTAATLGPCFMPTVNAVGNVVTLTPLNATALGGASAVDPCLVPFSDLEAVTFTDQNGHANTQWFERGGTTGNPNTLSEFYFGPGGVPAPRPSASLMPLNTSSSNPQLVDQATNSSPSSFSVLVLSSISAGPFKAQPVYWTAATSASCLAVNPASATNGVFTFTLSTPAPTTGTGSSPCLTIGGDTEEILFSDSFGNSNVQFFRL